MISSPSSYKECFSCKPVQTLVWSSFVTLILSSILLVLKLSGFRNPQPRGLVPLFLSTARRVLIMLQNENKTRRDAEEVRSNELFKMLNETAGLRRKQIALLVALP